MKASLALLLLTTSAACADTPSVTIDVGGGMECSLPSPTHVTCTTPDTPTEPPIEPPPVADACDGSAFPDLDGCKDAPKFDRLAPALSFQNPDAFTDGSIFQTPGFGSLGVDKINFKVAWKDYAVGADTSKGPWCDGTYVTLGTPAKPCSDTPGTNRLLINAADYDWTTDPAHACDGGTSIYKNYPDGSMDVRCKANKLANLEGFDWAPSSCHRGDGTSCCITVTITEGAAPVGGSMNIRNTRFKQPTTPSLACQFPNKFGKPGGAYLYQMSVPMQNVARIWDVDYSNNVADENSLTGHSLTDRNQPSGDNGMGPVSLYATGRVTSHYNYFGDANGRVMGVYGCRGMDFSYNAAPTAAAWPTAPHSEIPFFTLPSQCPNPAPMDFFKQVGNWLVSPYNIGGAVWTAIMVINSSAYAGQTANIALGEFSLNVIGANYVRPDKHYWTLSNDSKIAALICYDTAAAGCQGSGASVTGNYVMGDILEVIATGASINPKVRLSGAGMPYAATYWDGGDATKDLGRTTWYATRCISCAGTPSGAKVQFSTASFGWVKDTTPSNGVIGFFANANTTQKYEQLNIRSNFVYGPGAYNGILMSTNFKGTVCAKAQDVSGNIDLVTGKEFTFAGAGIPGC